MPSQRTPPRSFTFAPIGYVRSPFAEKESAPRQPNVGLGVEAEGTIVLLQGHGYEDALHDIEGWQYLWILFVFDRNVGEDGRAKWRPKVLPPRSDGIRRGVFSTRSPHRPNPIGMSVVQLTGASGLTLSIRGSDILDGTPVLDIKPYVPYADVRDDATTGWLTPKDPLPAYTVEWSARAATEAAFLATNGVDLVTPTDRALALGPQPHAYRRIRETKDGKVLAVKEWRVHFTVSPDGRTLRVESIASGYREKEREARADLEIHRAFVRAFSPQ